MRLHRFFIEDQLRNKHSITIFDEEIINQVKNVFRLQTRDRLTLLDNSGFEYVSEINLITKNKIEIKIVDASRALNIIDKELWLFASLIKKDHFEWVLEKCTEIGVLHFVPILSERSEKKNLNVDRAHKIIKEASEQSGRGIMPVLHTIVDLKNSFLVEKIPKLLLAFHLNGEIFNKKNVIDKKSALEKSLNINQEKSSCGIFIGPEGGWSTSEIELFTTNQVPLYTVGKQVLRAETAAVVISSLILL